MRKQQRMPFSPVHKRQLWYINTKGKILACFACWKELVRKVSKSLYFLRQLKKSHVATRELFPFYITCIRSILEYGCPVFYRARGFGLRPTPEIPTARKKNLWYPGKPSYQSEDLERLQKRTMKIIYPELSYKALELSGLFNTIR